jgi:hypothetical protein
MVSVVILMVIHKLCGVSYSGKFQFPETYPDESAI